MTGKNLKEVFLLTTPQQTGVIARQLNEEHVERPFAVGPVMATKASLFDMRIPVDANPVYITIGNARATWGEALVTAIPTGSVMRLQAADDCLPLALPWWNVLVNELARLAACDVPEDPPENEPTKPDDPTARGITGLTLAEEERLKALWKDNSLTYGDMSEEIFQHTASAEVLRKAGYKLGLPKRKVGAKSGR